MTEPQIPEASPAPSAPPPKPQPPPARPLPSDDDIAAWVRGAEAPVVGALWEQIDVPKFDILVAQVRKEDLLPQHWQPLPTQAPPPDDAFARLPEVERLRRADGDSEQAQRRLEALKAAWQELRGKRPALWEAADLFAAFRRILERKRPVAPYDLLTAARDVWRGLTLPRGEEQLLIFWNCLVQMRKVTKK